MGFPYCCFHCIYFSIHVGYPEGYCNIYDCLVAFNRSSSLCSHFKVR